MPRDAHTPGRKASYMKKDHRGCSRLPAHEVIGEGTRKILRVSQISFASYVRFCSLFLSSRHVSRCSLSALGTRLLRKRSLWWWCTVETGVLSQTSRATHPLVPWTALCLESGTPSLSFLSSFLGVNFCRSFFTSLGRRGYCVRWAPLESRKLR